MARNSKRQSRASVSATRGGTEFNPDYSDVKKDLKRIGTLAGTFFVILVILAFVIPMVMK
ncbi:MAG: hypothetical protein AB1846_00860 [Chloroflexota bacterium]